MANLLVDTDILIDTTRGVLDAVSYLQRHAQQSTLVVSTVTQLELLIGCRNRNEQRTTSRFLLCLRSSGSASR